MDVVCLKIYISENRKHKGQLLYEWILQCAKQLGVQGGFALRAISGYGRHGVLHEESFLELSADLPVEVVFYLSEEEKEKLLAALQKELLDVLAVTHSAQMFFLKQAP